MPPPLPADGFQRPNPRSGFPVGQKMGRRGADGSDDDGDEEEVDPQVAAALSAALFSDLTTQKQVVAANLAAEDGDGDGDGDDAAVASSSSAAGEASAMSGAEALEALSKPPAARRKECIFCDDKPAKYTCPRCNARTCSLACVKRHKAEAVCSGIVEAAAPVPLNEFSDKHLTRDYHFMQDMDRVVSNVQRGLDRHWRYDIRALPPPLYALREAAKKRGVLCQITSEGMSKRDRNTSRFDRRRDAIIWHIDFDVRGTVRSKNFRVESHWGNERFRLGDVFATAWQTNPALLCFHIRRGYNRASAWVEKGIERKPQQQQQQQQPAASPGDEAVESAAAAAEENAAEDQAPSPSAASKPQVPSLNGIPSALVETGEEDEFRTADDDAANGSKGVTVSDSDDDDDHGNDDENAKGRKQQPGGRVPEPTTPRSMTAKANVTRFLDESPNMATDLLFLVRAERLGTTEAYFRLNPDATIHDNLRHVFFVNEFPTVVVAKMQDAANYPIVTEEQRIAIRETFRPKNHRGNADGGGGFRPPTGGGAPPPSFQQHQQERREDGSDGPSAEGGQPQPPRVDFENLSDEQRERLSRVPCRQFRRNEHCDRGDACPFWHCPIAELPACRNMVQMGQCPLGPRCSFSHEEAVVRRTREDPEFRRVRRGGGDDDESGGHHDRRTSTRGGRGGSMRGGRGGGVGGRGGAYLRGFTGPAGGGADGSSMQQPPRMDNVGPSPPQHHHHDGASSAPPPSPVYASHQHQQHQFQQAPQAAFPPGYARYLPVDGAQPQHHHHHQHHHQASREPSTASQYGGGGGGWEPPQ